MAEGLLLLLLGEIRELWLRSIQRRLLLIVCVVAGFSAYPGGPLEKYTNGGKGKPHKKFFRMLPYATVTLRVRLLI